MGLPFNVENNTIKLNLSEEKKLFTGPGLELWRPDHEVTTTTKTVEGFRCRNGQFIFMRSTQK